MICMPCFERGCLPLRSFRIPWRTFRCVDAWLSCHCINSLEAANWQREKWFGSQFLVALSTITCCPCFGSVAALSGGWSVQQSKTTHLTTRKKKKNRERRAQSRTPQSPLRTYPKWLNHLPLGLTSQRFSDLWCHSGDQSFNTETLD